MPTGTLQLTTISSLNRQITIDPTGKVTASDSYRIISNSTTTLKSFVVSLPFDATNVAIRDEFGRALATDLGYSATGDIFLANATLITFLSSGQSTTLTAQYNLPSATLQGSNYVLSDFKLFPNFTYYVNKATITFTPPEGATIVTPQASSLDSSSTLTRQTYQDTLTITKEQLKLRGLPCTSTKLHPTILQLQSSLGFFQTYFLGFTFGSSRMCSCVFR